MSNFIAFRFCDNDFHVCLHDAINYVLENRIGELSLESWREFVLRGMVAFNSIRRIDEWAGKNPDTHSYEHYRQYFEKTLTVVELRSVKDLPAGFEGYVLDNHTLEVFYKGL